MIHYGRILRQKEKDNPSPFCRASYISSNVGDLIKCYGRCLRFPQDAHIYEKEMQLALGDVIMQCRLIDYKQCKVNGETRNSIEETLLILQYNTAHLTDHLMRGMDKEICFDVGTTQSGWETIENTLDTCAEICNLMNWNFDEISHLGFIHTIERFEQFEREGWK